MSVKPYESDGRPNAEAMLTPEQQRLCLENIRRCRAYAALPEDQKWKPSAPVEQRNVHHLPRPQPLKAPIGTLSRIA